MPRCPGEFMTRSPPARLRVSHRRQDARRCEWWINAAFSLSSPANEYTEPINRPGAMLPVRPLFETTRVRQIALSLCGGSVSRRRVIGVSPMPGQARYVHPAALRM
jgi:hypothetical protein